jgi:hypothetical protein
LHFPDEATRVITYITKPGIEEVTFRQICAGIFCISHPGEAFLDDYEVQPSQQQQQQQQPHPEYQGAEHESLIYRDGMQDITIR